jgi:zinc/manganese transport system substrate-binding protein
MSLRTILVFAAGAALLATAGCGGGGSGPARLNVVAAENAYGDIVRQLGGPRVHVTSILTDPNADPHLFEPGTKNGLAVAQAKVVIQNGLGYDAFIDKLESAAPSGSRDELVVADLLGVSGKDANPHLWYDVPRLPAIAAGIERALAHADPRRARRYAAALARFDRSLVPLQSTVAAIRRAHARTPIAYTEPVPGYLTDAAGLRNLAPSSFTRAIEDGTEPSAAAVAAMTALVRDRKVRVLLYNSQAVSPITSRIRAAARAAGIPVVPVTETLPPGATFQQWQTAQARALQAALAR